jgi:hypothetical protein
MSREGLFYVNIEATVGANVFCNLKLGIPDERY